MFACAFVTTATLDTPFSNSVRCVLAWGWRVVHGVFVIRVCANFFAVLMERAVVFGILLRGDFLGVLTKLAWTNQTTQATLPPPVIIYVEEISCWDIYSFGEHCLLLSNVRRTFFACTAAAVILFNYDSYCSSFDLLGGGGGGSTKFTSTQILGARERFSYLCW